LEAVKPHSQNVHFPIYDLPRKGTVLRQNLHLHLSTNDSSDASTDQWFCFSQIYFRLVCFELTAREQQTDKQTDGGTDEQDA